VRERSRSDPRIARKLAELAREVREDPFPLSRIEDVALTAKFRLEDFRNSLDPEELISSPTSNDPLTAVYIINQFVTEDISPFVHRLLLRTERLVQMVEGLPFGYGASGDEDEEEEDGVLFIVEDIQDDFTFIVESPEEMQEVWDTASPRIRDGMRHYAKFSKGQVIDRFLGFIEEYVPE
jgi:hypothetical protein